MNIGSIRTVFNYTVIGATLATAVKHTLPPLLCGAAAMLGGNAELCLLDLASMNWLVVVGAAGGAAIGVIQNIANRNLRRYY